MLFSLLASLFAHRLYIALEGSNRKKFYRLTFRKFLLFGWHITPLFDQAYLHLYLAHQTFRNVTKGVHLFGLTTKATWPKLSTCLGKAKINCRAYLQILGLPVFIGSISASFYYSILAVLQNDSPVSPPPPPPVRELVLWITSFLTVQIMTVKE